MKYSLVGVKPTSVVWSQQCGANEAFSSAGAIVGVVELPSASICSLTGTWLIFENPHF